MFAVGRRSTKNSKGYESQMEGKRLWQFTILGLLTLIFGSGLLGKAPPAAAMPMFSRKYNLPCAHCHTMPPRLTRFGYEFYRAGFRLPSNFRLPDNKAIPYTFANSVSAFS